MAGRAAISGSADSSVGAIEIAHPGEKLAARRGKWSNDRVWLSISEQSPLIFECGRRVGMSEAIDDVSSSS